MAVFLGQAPLCKGGWIEIKVDPYAWTDAGGAWWELGTPQVSDRPEVIAAAGELALGRDRQRRGV